MDHEVNIGADEVALGDEVKLAELEELGPVTPYDQDQHGYDARALARLDSEKIADDAVASLAGLVMRRLQELSGENIAGNEAKVSVKDLQGIFGEALQQFSADGS